MRKTMTTGSISVWELAATRSPVDKRFLNGQTYLLNDRETD